MTSRPECQSHIPPSNSTFQALYEVLKDHRALEKIQEILSPLARGAYYQDRGMRRGEFQVLAREFQAHRDYLLRVFEMDSLPNETMPDGITGADAAVGQFLWVALHEVGHATFDILDVAQATLA
jgi:hypothetical protein